MKKLLLLLCICLLSQHMVIAQSVDTREGNIFKYAGSKDCLKYIPLYGRPNQTLILKVYPAQQYMGSWMKSTEYPNSTYYATYNVNGLLASVESDNERSVYAYYSDNTLYSITRYNKNTGAQLSFEQPNSPSYDKNGYNHITDKNIVFRVWFNSRKDSDGDLSVRFNAISYKGGEYYIAKYKTRAFSSSNVRRECGLSWANHLRESDPYNPTAKMLTDEFYHPLYNSSTIYNYYGIPVSAGIDVVSGKDNFFVVGGKIYYEYTWTYGQVAE